MSSVYNTCFCDSDKKFKFCCYGAIKSKKFHEISPQKIACFPVILCAFSRTWEKIGMTNAFVVRKMPNGNYITSMYLIDAWCLGVKNVDVKCDITMQALSALLLGLGSAENNYAEASYQDARSLILGSLKYAKNLGFEPHSDWQIGQYLIESNENFEDKYTFGKDGKPFYVPFVDERTGEVDYDPRVRGKKISSAVL